jgi:hypothetical protein
MRPERRWEVSYDEDFEEDEEDDEEPEDDEDEEEEEVWQVGRQVPDAP